MDPQALMNPLQIAEHTAGSCRNLDGRERQNVGPIEHFEVFVCKESDTRSPWNQSRANWHKGRVVLDRSQAMVRWLQAIPPSPETQECGSVAVPWPWGVAAFRGQYRSPQHPQHAHSLSPPIWRTGSGRWSSQFPCSSHRPSKSSLCL